MFGLIIFIVALIAIAATLSVYLCLLFIDLIVHQQLYNYGLQFSYEWASPYWLASKTSYVLLGLISVVLIVLTYSYWTGWRPGGTRPAFLLKEESMLYKCNSCERTISKPIKMLDYRYKPVREVNVCPYCHKVLGLQIR